MSKKCQRCGRDEIVDSGFKLEDAVGADATKILTFRGINGVIRANVCEGCGTRLKNLGWKYIK